jgi:hypothetical protein
MSAMSALGPNDADRLAKFLGMLGSAHAGERAAAGLKADKLVREAGLTWHQVISSKRTYSMAEDVGAVLANLGSLSRWEMGARVHRRRPRPPKTLRQAA